MLPLHIAIIDVNMSKWGRKTQFHLELTIFIHWSFNAAVWRPRLSAYISPCRALRVEFVLLSDQAYSWFFPSMLFSFCQVVSFLLFFLLRRFVAGCICCCFLLHVPGIYTFFRWLCLATLGQCAWVLVILSVQEILSIRLYSHISKAWSFLVVVVVNVHISTPYNSIGQM